MDTRKGQTMQVGFQRIQIKMEIGMKENGKVG